MNIRPLRMEEMIFAEYNRTICFKMPKNDFEACRRRIAEGSIPMEGRWGAFDEENRLMSYLIDNPFEVYFDGQAVPCGGIGSVTTLPEYRGSGCIRALLTRVLQEGRKNGEIFSMLGPFSAEFYRKFGYETACAFYGHRLPVKQLAGYRHTGWTRRIHMADEQDLSGVCEVIDRFSRRYNLCLCRDESFLRRRWLNQSFEEALLTGTSAYLLGDEQGAKAYVMVDCQHADCEVLRVKDLAYVGAEGLRMLLGFLARMSADYQCVSLRLPEEVVLPALVPDSASVETRVTCGRMVRVLNVQRALELSRRPEGFCAVVEVEDSLLPDNSGRYRIGTGVVEKTDRPADLCADIRVFSQMLIGYLPLESALMRTDVALHGNCEQLERFFVKKPMFQWEHF